MAVTTNSDADGYTQSVESDNDGNDRTALLIEVSDYSGAVESVGGDSMYSQRLRSYLRLGAVPTAIREEYGKSSPSFTTGDNNGEDLASKVTSFIDDTRYRGTSSDDYYRLSNSDRSTETAKLHTRGGWRDHTDGNRVTTTRGDKIEVVVGNYKKIVMGRRQWKTGKNDWGSDNSLHWESSGGITYHYDQVPGQIVDVKWTTDQSGTYRVKEETQKGHVVERYEGRKKEWFFGDYIETRVGSRAAYDFAINASNNVPLPSEYHPENDGSGADGYVSDTDFDKNTATGGNESHTDAVAWPPTDDYLVDNATYYNDGYNSSGNSSDFVGYAPDVSETVFANSITEQTWARRIIDHTGSSTTYVPHIIDEDYVETLTEVVNAGQVKDWTVISNSHTERVYDDNVGQGVICKRSGSYVGLYAGSAGEAWGFGASDDYRNTNFREFFLAAFESMRMGLSLTSFMGVDVEARILTPLCFEFHSISVYIEAYLGGKTSWALGKEDVYNPSGAEVEMQVMKNKFAVGLAKKWGVHSE